MARNITVTFEDGTSHVYQNAPDDITPDAVLERAKSFGKGIANIDGGKKPSNEGMPEERKMPGFSDVIDTVIAAGTRPYQQVANTVGGLGVSAAEKLGIMDEGARAKYDQKIAQQTAAYEQQYGSNPELKPLAKTLEFGVGAGMTAPVGGLIAKPLKYAAAEIPAIARFVTPVAESIASGGFKTGIAPSAAAVKAGTAIAPTVGQRAADIGVRALGGGVTGGAASGIMGEDVGTGAAIGAAVPTAGAAIVGKIAQGLGWSKDFVTGKLPSIKAGVIAREALGDELPRALQVLKNAPEGITPAQALQQAGINADAFMALESFAKEGKAVTWYRLLEKSQKADQKNQLATIVGGNTATEARNAQNTAKNALLEKALPIKEKNLKAANLYSKTVNELNPLPNKSIADSVQTRLKSLTEQGVKPIDTNAIVDNIASKLNDPKIGPSDVATSVLNKVSDKIKRWTVKNGGVIDADALYTIRKTAVTESIEKLYRGDPQGQAKYAATLLSEIKPVIDDAIIKAGGKTWDKYLKTFETGMHGIDQQKLAAVALDKFEGNPEGFIKLVTGKNPEAVEKVFGYGSHDIFKEMGRHSGTLENIANQLERDIAVKAQAASGTKYLSDILNKEKHWITKLPWLSKGTTAANATLAAIQNNVNQKVKNVFAEGFKSGKSLVDIINTLPSSEQAGVLKMLRNSTEFSPAITTGLATRRNALAPENRNNLRQQ